MSQWVRGFTLVFLACFILFPQAASADVVMMRSGREIHCVILQDNGDSITVRLGYGTMIIPRDAIREIQKTPEITSAPASQPTQEEARILSADRVIDALLTCSWSKHLQQIPATVIDTGVMRSVPYQSFRCGEDYEINVYGDPDAPAGVEIGIYRSLLNDPTAQSNCINFITSVLSDPSDSAVVKTLALRQDLKDRDGLSFEITPPTAEDAYGGWWVSVYDEKLLDSSRATPEELDQITVARRPSTRPATPSQKDDSSDQASAAPPQSPPSSSGPEVQEDWSSQEIARARAPKSSTGRVYVRGYQRKDGTYVRPHSRSAPHRRK